MNKYFLGVGINEYPFNELKNCVKDVVDFKKKICNRIADENTILLLDKNANKQAIKTSLYAMVSCMTGDDIAILYLSGHGIKTIYDKKLCEAFVPFDAIDENGDIDPDKFMIDLEFNHIFKKIPKEGMLLMIGDYCHSGDSHKKFNLIPKSVTLPEIQVMINEIIAKTSNSELRHRTIEEAPVVLISACQPDETAMDSLVLKNGVLTYYLIESILSYPLPVRPTIRQIFNDTTIKIKNNHFYQNPGLYGVGELFDKSFC